MTWKKNKNDTVYVLKNNDLDIRIQQIIGVEGWYLSCTKLGISQKLLDAEDFDEAVKEAQILIMDKASKVYRLASEFVMNVHSHNMFENF